MPRPISPLPRLSPRALWALLGMGCLGLVAGSFLLTAWYGLNPCHLCIFQRLLFMVLAALGLLAALSGSRLAGALILPTAAAGLAVAAYQSWLQAQPAGSVACQSGQPGPIEQLVEWLGQRLPELFLATGFCEDAELFILGLSLANWALISFLACLGLAALALCPTRPRPE